MFLTRKEKQEFCRSSRFVIEKKGTKREEITSNKQAGDSD